MPATSLLNFFLAIYFEHFTSLEIELLLETPLVIGASRNRSLFVLLIKFA
jgi:hypothetical protein